jgi:hypothetical protein
MAQLNGWRLPLLAAVVALTLIGAGALILGDGGHEGIIIAMIGPTIVALTSLLRGEQAHSAAAKRDRDRDAD